MSTIRINVSDARLDELSVADMVAIENVGERKISTKALRAILAKFVANDAGEYLPEDDALKVIDQIKRPQFIEVVREFFQKVNETAINPTSDSS